MVIYNVIFILLIKTILNKESECPIIECNIDKKIKNDTCLIYNPKENKTVFLKVCDNENYYCPLQSDEFEEGILKCIKKKNEKKKIFQKEIVIMMMNVFLVIVMMMMNVMEKK